MIVTLGGLELRTEPTEYVNGVQFKLVEFVDWYSSATIRTDLEDMPDSDGAFEPEQSLRGSKQMSLEGWVLGKSVEQAVVAGYDVLTALSPLGQAIAAAVEDFGLTRYQSLRINGQIKVKPFTGTKARFQVPVVAADSRKYGPVQTESAGPSGGSGDGLIWPLFGGGTLDFGTFSPSGIITFRNDGTAPSWPMFRVAGSVDAAGFQIISGTNVIEYLAAVPAGSVLTLDPYSGGRATIGGVDVTGAALTRSEWAPVLPGEVRNYVFDPLGTAGASAMMEADFREAWW